VLVERWMAGAGGRRAGEEECVLTSGGMMKCEILVKLKGRDGSRPGAMCLMEVANQLGECISEGHWRRTYPDNGCLFLEDGSCNFQAVKC
jgi:hypothetical protein